MVSDGARVGRMDGWFVVVVVVVVDRVVATTRLC
jgi:hypothetical protein